MDTFGRRQNDADADPHSFLPADRKSHGKGKVEEHFKAQRPSHAEQGLDQFTAAGQRLCVGNEEKALHQFHRGRTGRVEQLGGNQSDHVNQKREQPVWRDDSNDPSAQKEIGALV